MTNNKQKNKQNERAKTLGTFLKEYKWIIIASAWAVAFIFGLIGFSIHFGADASPGRVIYLTMQLFVLESGAVTGDVNVFLEIARFLAPVAAGATALTALAYIFYEQYQLLTLNFIPDHVIICGLGRIGNLLAKAYRDQGMKVVTIERNTDNDNIRPCRSDGIIVMIGDSVDEDVLKRAKIGSAKYLVAGTGDDGLNAEVAWQAKQIMKTVNRKEPLRCFVHIEGSSFYKLLSKHPIVTESRSKSFELCPFNIHSRGAQILLDKNPPVSWDEVDFDPENAPPVVILGFGRFGKAVAVESVIRWHLKFPGSKIKIKVFDRKATLREKELERQFPNIKEYCDFEWKNVDLEEVTFDEKSIFPEEGKAFCSNVYICVGNDRLGLTTALILYPSLDESTRIIIRTDLDMGLTRLIQEAGKDAYGNLHAFELLDETCRPDQLGHSREELAAALHMGWLENIKKKNPDDKSMREWEQVPDCTKLINRMQADAVPRILALAGFGMVLPDTAGVVEAEISDNDFHRLAQFAYRQKILNMKMENWEECATRDHGSKQCLNLVSWDDFKGKEKYIALIKQLPDVLRRIGYLVVKKQK